MSDHDEVAPESSAVRVALWRALHVQVDARPHVIEDEVGLKLASPEDGWRDRPDMDPGATQGFRAAIVARARFLEDLVEEASEHGVDQYIILGAGLDTFAQRRPDLTAKVRVFEVDEPGPQAWKRQRLIEVGLGVPEWLRFVPVDFEVTTSWFDLLADADYDIDRPAIVASTGVSLYLTREAILVTLERLAGLAPRSTVAMAFILPPDLLDAAGRAGLKSSETGARQSGTPFLSFYAPEEILNMAHNAGFKTARHVAGASLANRYFSGRDDDLRPSLGEDFLIATT